jgi:hypothetical protein
VERRLGILLVLTLAGCRDDASHTPDDGGGTTADPSAGSSSTGGGLDTSGSADESSTGSDTDGPPQIVPAPGGLRRLTTPQYLGSIEVLLGGSARDAASPPADQAALGFDTVGGATFPLSPSAIEQYERSAIDAAAAAVAQPFTLGTLVPCVVDGPFDEGCYVQVAEKLGRAAWRRPITADEYDHLLDVARAARQLNHDSFEVGLKYEIAMILQAPAFIYAVELGAEDDEGRLKLTTDEWVTRLALFVLGRAPSAETFARVDAGQLDGADAPRELATEWLQQGTARTAVGGFFDELLRIREVELKSKDPELFPLFTPEAAAAMHDETLMLVDDVVFGEARDLRRLFDAEYTFANATLAEIYGVSVAGDDFERIDLPAGQGRLGILSHPSLLAVGAHNDRNSPTRRGLFIQRNILCNDVPPPPGDVDINLPEPPEPTTLRSRLEGHLGAEMCQGCHGQTDPIGFAFEHYDASGVWRELDAGFPIDASGDVDGLGTFDGAAELSLLVRDDPRLGPCLVRNLYRHAIGRGESEETEPALEYLTTQLVDAEFDLQHLMVELVTNPAFLEVGAAQ